MLIYQGKIPMDSFNPEQIQLYDISEPGLHLDLGKQGFIQMVH